MGKAALFLVINFAFFALVSAINHNYIFAKKPSPTPTPAPTPTPSPTPSPIPQTAGDIGLFSTTTQAQLPKVFSQHSLATANIGTSTYLYVLGGASGAYQSSVYKALLNSTTGSVDTFTTTAQAQLPQNLAGHTTIANTIDSSTFLYVLGGYNGTYHSSVYKAPIDNTTGDVGVFSSTYQNQLPKAITNHTTSTATVGTSSYVYVIGGRNASANLSTVYKTVLEANTGDVTTFSTTLQKQLPQAISQHASNTATIGTSTYVYLLGGTNNSGNSISTAYKAPINSITGDIGNFSTTSQAQLPRTINAGTTVITSVGPSTYLYVLGGKNNSISLSTVFKATLNGITGDISPFRTTNQFQLPQVQSQHAGAASTFGTSSYIYLLGGNNGVTNTSSVYKSILHN